MHTRVLQCLYLFNEMLGVKGGKNLYGINSRMHRTEYVCAIKYRNVFLYIHQVTFKNVSMIAIINEKNKYLYVKIINNCISNPKPITQYNRIF